MWVWLDNDLDIITRKQLAELQAFSEDIAEGLNEADEDFATRKRMLNFLGV